MTKSSPRKIPRKKECPGQSTYLASNYQKHLLALMDWKKLLVADFLKDGQRCYVGVRAAVRHRSRWSF